MKSPIELRYFLNEYSFVVGSAGRSIALLDEPPLTVQPDVRGKEATNVDAIVDGDIADINESDLIIANCPKPSYGTAMEIFYASHILQKPVWIVCADERPSPWLIKHSQRIFRRHQDAMTELAQ